MLAIADVLSPAIGEENAERLRALGNRVVDQAAMGVGVGVVMVVAQEIVAHIGLILGPLGFLGTALISWRNAKYFYCIYLSSKVDKNIAEIFEITLKKKLNPYPMTERLHTADIIALENADVKKMKRVLRKSIEFLRQVKEQ